MNYKNNVWLWDLINSAHSVDASVLNVQGLCCYFSLFSSIYSQTASNLPFIGRHLEGTALCILQSLYNSVYSMFTFFWAKSLSFHTMTLIKIPWEIFIVCYIFYVQEDSKNFKTSLLARAVTRLVCHKRNQIQIHHQSLLKSFFNQLGSRKAHHGFQMPYWVSAWVIVGDFPDNWRSINSEHI